MHTFLNVHINSIPVSDRVCKCSVGSCTGMWSINGAREVSGGTETFVGLISEIQ